MVVDREEEEEEGDDNMGFGLFDDSFESVGSSYSEEENEVSNFATLNMDQVYMHISVGRIM
jgi:hypothetical protein